MGNFHNHVGIWRRAKRLCYDCIMLTDRLLNVCMREYCSIQTDSSFFKYYSIKYLLNKHFDCDVFDDASY